MRVKGMVPAALKLYRTDGRPFRPEAVEGAVLLGELLGAQLELSLLEAEVRRLEREELRALRMEISPHFVFNTLHAVAATCGHDPERARRLVLDFAEFLRHALRAHGEFCTVEEELWYVEHYLNFERMRLGERLRVEVEIPRSLWNLLVPVLTLQPLVENAVVHGVEPKPGPGTVRVRGWEEDGVAVFTVEDDGVGIPEELVEHVTQRGVGSGLGVGLFNVHRRLETIYGPGFGLRVESQEGKGTRVVVRIPRGFPGHRP
jgi:two-component system LytT family sensor kinase